MTSPKAESEQNTSTEPEVEREKGCDVLLMAWEKMSEEISVKNVRKRNVEACESNHCCQRYPTMPSHCTVVELRLSVKNITPLSVSTETQESCRAAVINNIHVPRSSCRVGDIFPHFKQIWSLSSDFRRSLPVCNSTKIRQAGAELIHADTDGDDEANRCFSLLFFFLRTRLKT